jgi:hypothetical protein
MLVRSYIDSDKTIPSKHPFLQKGDGDEACSQH